MSNVGFFFQSMQDTVKQAGLGAVNMTLESSAGASCQKFKTDVNYFGEIGLNVSVGAAIFFLAHAIFSAMTFHPIIALASLTITILTIGSGILAKAGKELDYTDLALALALKEKNNSCVKDDNASRISAAISAIKNEALSDRNFSNNDRVAVIEYLLGKTMILQFFRQQS